MANIKSQKKRILTNQKSYIRNKSVKSEIKTLTKKFYFLSRQNSNKRNNKICEIFKQISSKLDKAAQKNIIHKNRAAKKKSHLSIQYSKLKKI